MAPINKTPDKFKAYTFAIEQGGSSQILIKCAHYKLIHMQRNTAWVVIIHHTCRFRRNISIRQYTSELSSMVSDGIDGGLSRCLGHLGIIVAL